MDTVLAPGYALFTWQEYESRIRGGQNSYSIRIIDHLHNAPLVEAVVLWALNVLQGRALPAAIAIFHGCGFVARGFAMEPEHLKNLLVTAVRHRGLSYIDVIQPCISQGTRPFSWYKDRIRRLDEACDPADPTQALKKPMEWSEKYRSGCYI